MLRRIDAFAKPREDLREKSALGGFITLVASLAAACLFLGQMYAYVTGVTRHSLHLSQSHWVPVPTLDSSFSRATRPGAILLKLHVSFPHLACSRLDLTHDGMSYRDEKFREVHGSATKVSTRPLTNSEWSKATGERRTPNPADLNNGCSFSASYYVPRVGGAFAVGLSQAAWAESTTFLIMGLSMFKHGDKAKQAGFNTTHYIHSITFGDSFPLATNPLQDDIHVIENESGGIALSNVNVKLIPTRYQGSFLSRSSSSMYQMSVTEHVVQPETLASQGSRYLPGLAVTYDFTPLAVHHVEARDSPLVFLSSLISIVGGVFVTVSLVTGCLVHSAAEIAKKID